MCAMWCFYVVLIAAFDLVVIASLPQTAFVEIAICENTKQCSSVYPAYKLKGSFTNIGSKDKAEGDVLQIHPFGLCNISNGDALYEAEWVGVVKLTIPSRESRECNGTVQKAIGAIQKGAKAVIFDITDSPNAENELNARKSILQHPVIVISGDAAHSLMSIVSRQKVLKARISVKADVRQTQDSSGEYVDMVIFMTCFVLITVTCFILLLKIKWKQTKKESSLAKMAFDAVSGMESKKYEERDGVEPVKRMKEKQWERKLSIHSCSVVGISCVICLEEFKEGQEIRVVSCGHEFHLKCVDPWLLTNYTCPLCMLNIVEREGKGIKTESRCTLSFRSLFRCCFASSALSSSSMVYSITLEDTPNDGLSFVSNAAVESLHFSPLSPNFNHNLWTEHLPVLPVLTNGDLQDSQTTGSHGSTARTLCVPSSIIMNKDISQLAVSKSPSVHGTEIPYLQESDGRLRQENTAKAIQIADLGIRKYAELGDAV